MAPTVNIMPLKIAISGSTGLVGTALLEYFKSGGHQVSRIIRKTTDYTGEDPCIVMDVSCGSIESEKLEGHDVIIHLAGANIAQKWSSKYKRAIFSSRIDSTKLLSSAIAALNNKPNIFLSASAIGFYGNHKPEEVVDERTPLGSDYLAQICQHWEAAAKEVKKAGVRVVFMRMGVVLSKSGGALAKMLPAFKLGLGGRLASGKQVMSWIALDEIPLITEHIINDGSISGPVNFVSPNPLTNKEFTSALGHELKRPTVFPVPSFAIKMLFGEMGETLLLNGSNVAPKSLRESHYQFRYPDIKSALSAALSS